jgi:outer membrane protein
MKKIFFLFMLISATSVVFGQKFGYVNTQELLASLPEIKAADNSLETHQKMLIQQGQTKVQAFEAEYKKYSEDAQKGILSQVQIQAKEAELMKKQEEIQKFEVQIQQDLGKKKEELYKPILDKVSTLIKTFGKENGYTMIFDSSLGSILHAAEADDLLPALKTKLGVK